MWDGLSLNSKNFELFYPSNIYFDKVIWFAYFEREDWQSQKSFDLIHYLWKHNIVLAVSKLSDYIPTHESEFRIMWSILYGSLIVISKPPSESGKLRIK